MKICVVVRAGSEDVTEVLVGVTDAWTALLIEGGVVSIPHFLPFCIPSKNP